MLKLTSKKKKQTTVSTVMFEIVEMYIFQTYLQYFFTCILKQHHDLFYFWFCSRNALLWKDFSCFRRLILSLSWKSNDRGGLKFWTYLHATVLLAVKYSAELNKYILIVRVICEKYWYFSSGSGYLPLLSTCIFRK
jgi:hypothetical protein